MKKIEAIIRPFKLESVKDELSEIGIEGITVIEAKEFGSHPRTQTFRGQEYSVFFLPKIKLELMVADNQLDAAVAAIFKSTETGDEDECKLFVSTVDGPVRPQARPRVKLAA
jgi:nitrogen regulatory protein P-II 1